MPLALHSGRVSYLTPYLRQGDARQFFEQASQCRYFYLGAFSYYPYNEAFYPEKYLGGARVVAVDRLEGMVGDPILGMLVERTDGINGTTTKKSSDR